MNLAHNLETTMPHPNRSKQRYDAPDRNPSPDEIRGAREDSGLSQRDAAKLIYCTERAWQDWESEARRMHPAFWELFRIKLRTLAGPVTIGNDRRIVATLRGAHRAASDSDRQALEWMYVDLLVRTFGTHEAAIAAKEAHDRELAKHEKYPSGDAAADEIMRTWLEADSNALYTALKRKGWTRPEGARMEVSVHG